MRNGALRHTGSSSLSSASIRSLAWTPTVASCSRARARLRVGVVSGKRGSISTSPSLPARPGRSASRGAAWQRPLVKAQAAATGILPLGFDLLTFLGSTVVVVPLFKKLKISPVLGFLLSGVVLHQLGLIRDPKDMEALSELGVLFLLFEMGLELSLDRLKALAKFAFGLGTLQMVICTGIFTAFALPAGSGLGTKLLETLAHAPTSLVSIRSVDEAVVIGGALSMSSSAFVLQLLTERGEMPTRFGSATLGILLLQDIAVVPFLVLLPLAVQLKTGGGGATEAAAAAAAAAAGNPASLVALLGPTAAKTFAGLGLLLVGGRLLLRRVFEVVAQSDNSETFVALCLLTVAGAALLTESLGFSDTMGAFVAGVLLSESSYKTQVEADIRPFRGLLLGLFFVTTGGSINMEVLRNNWEVITWILVGLITVKTSVVACLGPWFGLKPSESIRTGFMLSQGGEFAFVLLSLASSLHVLPDNLNQVLIIVVVMSMALTPGLAQCGKVAGEFVENMMSPRDEGGNLLPARTGEDEVDRMAHGVEDPVVICGFGPHGQMLAALLDQPLASLPDPTSRAYIAFDLNPSRVQAAREAGFNVVYGDGSRAAVLKAAGVVKPRALAVCLTSNMVAAHRAVAALRTSYPNVPIFALGQDIREAAELEEAGADRCLMSSTNVGLALGTEILSRLGASVQEAAQVGKEMEEAMTLKAHNLAEQVARYGTAALETEETSIVLHGRTSYVTRGSSTMARNAANNGMQVVEVMMSTPAPPDSLPSMAEAMPSFVRKSMSDSRQGSLSSADELSFVVEEVHQPVPALMSANGRSMNGSLEGSADEGALEHQGTQHNGNGGGHKSSNGNGRNGSSKGSANAKKMIRNRIAGTATARYDCASDDDECKMGNEVAGIVLVDASKQQLQQEVVEAAVRADAAAAAREARRRSPVAARTGESLPGSASYYDEQ